MKNYRRLSFLVSFVLAGPTLGMSTVVQADEPLASLPSEDAYFSPIPVVLSATRLAQPKSDAPAAITVIDRSMIEASGIREIPALMRLVPGFQVGHDSDTQFAPEQTPVTYLGYSDQFSRRMQVLVDGRSVYDPMFGGVRWNDLGLQVDDIERIEVIRGPNAASYGSNAFLGVINIITRDPGSSTGTTAAMETSSAGKRLASARHFGGNDKYKYRITASHLEQAPHVGRHDALRTDSVGYRGNIKLAKNSSLDVHLGISTGPRQVGDSTDQFDPEHDGYVTNNYQQIKWTHRASASSEYSVQLFHNYNEFDNQYRTTLYTYPTDIFASTKSQRWDVEFQQTFAPGGKWRWVWGAGSRLDEAYAKDWFNSNEWQRNWLNRLFANGEWRPGDRWTFNLGAMAERSTVAGDTISPRLAANYHINESDTARIAISEGYRAPSLFEQNADTVVHVNNVSAPPGTTYHVITGGGNLSAAKVDNFEIGYLHNSANDRLTIDSRVFLMQFRNIISYYQVAGTPAKNYFINGGAADIYGAEIQGKYRFSKKTSLLANYAYAVHNGSYVTDPSTSPATTDSSSNRTPTHTFSVLLDHKINADWSASMFYQYVSNVYWFNGASFPNGYHILNARIARQVRFGAKQGSVELIGQNLAGDYSDFTDHLKLYKTVYLGIRIPL